MKKVYVEKQIRIKVVNNKMIKLTDNNLILKKQNPIIKRLKVVLSMKTLSISDLKLSKICKQIMKISILIVLLKKVRSLFKSLKFRF